MTKTAKKITLAIIIVFAALILFNASTVVTRPGEYRVVRQFGKIVRVDAVRSGGQ